MSKTKIYFDSNIYADIIRQGIAVDSIKGILNTNKMVLIISSLNLYEAVSCWKSGNSENIQEGVIRFQLFKDLLPCRFLKEVHEISLGEINKAMNGQGFDIFYAGIEAENEINKLANGTFDSTAKTFIENKWNSKLDEVRQRKEYFKQIAGVTIPEEFQAFLSNHQQSFAEHIIGERVIGIPARNKRRLAEKMLQNPHKFPLFTALVRANLFLDYRLLKHSSFSHDTLDDAKHLIIASYANVFVSSDDKLRKYSCNINPHLKVLSLSEFRLTSQK
jgi:hypothetical protein